MADKDAAAAAAMAPTQQQPAINDATIPIAQVVVAGAAQNIPQALPTVAATPMRQLQFPADQGSAVSSLTDGPPSAAANTNNNDTPAPKPTINNNKRSTAPPTLENTPSPKKSRLDFSKPLRDDKDYLSVGGDEEEWGKEEKHNIRLINDPNCPDPLAVSVYDTKPVHLLSTSEETMDFEIDEMMIGYNN